MFPKALSGGKLSLRVANGERMPNEDNEGVALTIQVDVSRLNGSIRSYDIYPSSISGVTRMTYEDVDARLKEEGGKSDLHLLNECAIARYRKREDQGAINILLPELDVVVSNADARGGDARSEIFLRRRDNSASKILVSEMMILAGEIAGSFGVENSLALPFRGQGEPRLLDEETWDTIPDGVCAEMAMRSCMTASSQGITPRPHHSLGLSAYVQFTSPIRRYADLLAHYQIKSYLRSGKHSSEISNEKLELVLSEAGANASVGIKTQREISKYWVTEYFSRRLASSSNSSTDNVYEATVVKSMRSEAFALALLEDTGFETPFKLLRENDFKLGQVVKIKVDSANPIEQQLFFSQVYESSEDHDDNDDDDNNTNDNH
jgi:exoribonuclease-2